MPQDHSHDYTPKGPQLSEESLKGWGCIMLMLAPLVLISSCFKLACPSETRAAQTEYGVGSSLYFPADASADSGFIPDPESLPPSPPADL